MPKATPGSRASARLQTPGAEGVEEGAVLERKTAGKVALEAVTELDSKFEEWHLQAKHRAHDDVQLRWVDAGGYARLHVSRLPRRLAGRPGGVRLSAAR